MAKATMYFPPDFKWGAATAAHQVEGHNTNNDWWAWEHGEGHISGGQKSGQACDWWGDGFERDLDFAEQMHHTGHRLSIEWSRIEPQEGVWDTAAIDRYRYMLSALRRRGIEPMVTLHHFSNPLWVAERAGWETNAVVPWFARFVSKAVDSLKDLCDLWVTINEPNVYVLAGYVPTQSSLADYELPAGSFPPGKGSLQLAFTVAENMLRGHAAAYQAIHQLQANARVGVAHNMRVFDPARSGSLLDRFCAANRDQVFNQTLLTGVLTGRYDRPWGVPHWIRGLKNTLDFIGLNYYSRDLVRFDRSQLVTAVLGRNAINPDAPMSDGNYGELYPHGLFRMLKRLERTGKPIFITENGLPDADDDQRPGYLLT
ncbi:MAG TPA: family 1 glycosylhydrolase, partial [Anaerolineae bacterium]|nr:family 1 glycosylhydrolase [Anaerolineae bacterium]